MFQVTPRLNFLKILSDNRPRAVAFIQGDGIYEELEGYVYFYEVPTGGLLIEAEIFGLPDKGRIASPVFYGFHMHEVGNCAERFSKTGGHYNPTGAPHPAHAGDFPPLRSGDGYAWLAFYNSTLELYEIIGKSVVIHLNVDDFTSQPAGNSGEKIGCGVIRAA